MSLTIDKSTTSKEKPACVVDGYVYYSERSSGDKTSWCCNRNRHGQCKTRLQTINDRVLRITGAHNHEPNASATELMDARTRMKEEAISSTRSTQDIIAGSISSLSVQAIASLPHLINLNKTIPCIRQKAQISIGLPPPLISLLFPLQLTRTLEDKTFLEYDSRPKNKRVVIFSTEKQWKIMKRSSTLFVDGTFSVVPSLFFQLYTIHCEYLGNVSSIVYALLPGRKGFSVNDE